MSTRWQPVVAAALLTLGACGGGSTPSGPPTTTTTTNDSATVTESSIVAADEWVSATLPATVDARTALSDRAAVGAELERALVLALADASGLSDLLGTDVTTAVDELLAAETESVRAEWLRRGIDPLTAEAALQAGPTMAGPGASRAVESAAGTGGVLALVLSMTAAFEPVFMKSPDVSGHITDTVEVDTTSTRAGLTLTLDEHASVDLALCPDEAGLAEGTVTVEVDLAATGTRDGVPIDVRASGTFSISVEATADGNAHLVSADNHVTGTIVATAEGGDTTTWADVDGVGVPLTFDGEGDVSGGRPHGQAVGVAATIDQLAQAFIKSGGVLAVMHGKTAERFWTDGGCVMLEINGVPGSELGDSAEVQVTATHKIDLGPVDGTVTATAVDGTVSPESADVPARFRLTVDPGEEVATTDLEQRSCRGVARGQWSVDARSYRVAVGGENQLTLTGAKCDGPAGLWTLVFGGVVNDAGFEVTFSGTLVFEVAADLSATYSVDLSLDATNLPPELSAQLGISGGGSAVFVDDELAPRFDILDGDLAVAASGSGPGGVSVDGIVQQGPTGASSLPVKRAACG
jgi:hypothetical protein